MVNGLPGKMATEVAKKVGASDEFYLFPDSFTGAEIQESYVLIDDKQVTLIKPEGRLLWQEKSLPILSGAGLSVDFTHPSAVNANASFYCSNRMPL